jgi:type VI protein secretion system component VasK
MWILHFLPDTLILWFCNLLLLAGVVLTVAGFFAHQIPLVSQYQLPFRILGIALLTLGVYFRGGYSVETAWRERVAEVEAKLKIAEQQSTKENTRIQTKTVNRTKLIRERGEEIVKYVDREVVKYDTKFMPGGICEIPQEFIKAHNDAAEVPKK